MPYFLPAAEAETEQVRGVPTGCSVSPLMCGSAHTLVWPDPSGDAEGYAITPLCPEAVKAAKQSPKMHELLALTDLVRSHRSSLKERSQAAQRLEHLILGPVAF